MESDVLTADEIQREVDLVTSVKLTEMETYLKDRGADKPCEACARVVTWSVRSNGDYPLLTQQAFYTEADQVEVYYSAFCPSCGNTRFFNARFVAHFISAMRDTTDV